MAYLQGALSQKAAVEPQGQQGELKKASGSTAQRPGHKFLEHSTKSWSAICIFIQESWMQVGNDQCMRRYDDSLYKTYQLGAWRLVFIEMSHTNTLLEGHCGHRLRGTCLGAQEAKRLTWVSRWRSLGQVKWATPKKPCGPSMLLTIFEAEVTFVLRRGYYY